MKIVFWGEEDEELVRSNMLAVSTYLATRGDYRAVMIAAGKKKTDISKYFAGSAGDACYVKESCAYYALEGLDYLMAAGKRGKLSKLQVQNSMKSLMGRRLYCIGQKEDMGSRVETKSRFDILEQVIFLANELVDFTFIDCGCERDEWTRQRFREADLVVVNFKQSSHALEKFFLSEGRIPERCCYVVGDYQRDSVYNKRNLNRMYRIEPEQIGAIPYNMEFHLDYQKGQLDKFMKGRGNLYSGGDKKYFFDELEKTMQILLGYHEDGEV